MLIDRTYIRRGVRWRAWGLLIAFAALVLAGWLAGDLLVPRGDSLPTLGAIVGSVVCGVVMIFGAAGWIRSLTRTISLARFDPERRVPDLDLAVTKVELQWLGSAMLKVRHLRLSVNATDCRSGDTFTAQATAWVRTFPPHVDRSEVVTAFWVGPHRSNRGLVVIHTGALNEYFPAKLSRAFRA